MSDQRFAIKVIWQDGEEEFLKEGAGPGSVAVFPNRERAERLRVFMLEGTDSEDVQSINVVVAPAPGEEP